MKNSVKLILGIAFLTFSFILINSGCTKKDDPVVEYDDPIVSTTGEATVGRAGGTISIGDESSVIYGANIVIPQDALEEDVDISIVLGTEEYINGALLQTVDFLPNGLAFNEQVVIGIPWTTDDQSSSNSRIYYYNEENSAIEELAITNVDVEKKITYGLTSHFSRFFNKRQYYLLGYNLMSKNNKFLAYVNLYTPLLDILPKLKDSPYANAEEIVIDNNGLEDCFAGLNFILWKKDRNRARYIQAVARQDFYIKYDEKLEHDNHY